MDYKRKMPTRYDAQMMVAGGASNQHQGMTMATRDVRMSKIQDMHREVERHLNEIHSMFIPEVRLTFIARLPENNEADVLITLDDIGQLRRLLDRIEAKCQR